MTLTIGFIGCGLIARSHARRLAPVDQARVGWVFDIGSERAKSFATETGADAVASAQEVVDRSDAIYVTTWTSAHPGLVEMACAAGKPVFCEKPLAVDLATAQAMTEMVEASGVVNQVGLILRHSPSYRWLRHHAQNEVSGTPMSLVFRDDQYIPIQGMYGSTWRADRALAGAGTLLEHSIHDLDLIEWCLGRIVSLHARTNNSHGLEGIEDQASVLLVAESGAHALLSSTWHDVMTRPSLRSVELFCRGGAFAVQGDWLGPVIAETGGEPAISVEGRPLQELAGELDGRGVNPDADFVSSVINGHSASPDFRTALRAHVLADAAYRSAAAGGEPIEV